MQTAVTALTAAWEALVSELSRRQHGGQIVEHADWCTVQEIRRNERKAALDEARRLAEAAFKEMIAAARDREALDRFFDRESRRAHALATRSARSKKILTRWRCR